MSASPVPVPEADAAWTAVAIRRGYDPFVVTHSPISGERTSSVTRAAPRSASVHFEQALEGALDGCYILRAEKDGQHRVVDFVYVYANDRAAQQMGVPKTDFIGRRLSELFPVVLTNGFLDECREVFKRRCSIEREQKLTPGYVRARWVRYQLVGLPDGVAVNVRDVTRSRRAELALYHAEERFRLLVESARDHAFVILDASGRIDGWNASAERLFRYRAREIVGRHASVLQGSGDALDLDHALTWAAERGSFSEEAVRLRKGGGRFWASIAMSPLREDGRLIGFGVVVRDISERRQAQAARAQLAALVENSEEAIISYTLEGVVLTWNAAASRLYGYSPAEAIGSSLARLSTPSRPDEWRQLLERVKKGERVPWHETERRRRDGQPMAVSLSVSPVRDEHGRIVAASAIVHDIRELKTARERLAASLAQKEQLLAQKEVLLKEVHHRVKNNLQIIASLMRLQSRRASEASTREMFAESEARVRAIALLYERIQQTSEVAHVELGGYLRAVARDVLRSMVTATPVRFRFALDDVVVDVDKALPAGLIVNELVSNAVKHAFPNRSNGSIQISLRKAGSEVHLAVEDDGVGLPSDFAMTTVDTLGLQLVTQLSHQLGTLDVPRVARGARFVVGFKI